MFIGILLPAAPISYGTTTLSPTKAARDRARALKCPLLREAESQRVPPPAAPPTRASESCLVGARALDARDATIFDLRDRDRYLNFHVASAKQATLSLLAALPKGSQGHVVVYENGWFRADALMLCDQLRRIGLGRARVVDGGIAAWAQQHALPQAMSLSRLPDNAVAAAVTDRGNRTIALARYMEGALPQRSFRKEPQRVVLLADTTVPLDRIRASLQRKTTTLYWVGTADRLNRLLGDQLAQERKRLAGPAQSKACSGL